MQETRNSRGADRTELMFKLILAAALILVFAQGAGAVISNTGVMTNINSTHRTVLENETFNVTYLYSGVTGDIKTIFLYYATDSWTAREDNNALTDDDVYNVLDYTPTYGTVRRGMTFNITNDSSCTSTNKSFIVTGISYTGACTVTNTSGGAAITMSGTACNVTWTLRACDYGIYDIKNVNPSNLLDANLQNYYLDGIYVAPVTVDYSCSGNSSPINVSMKWQTKPTVIFNNNVNIVDFENNSLDRKYGDWTMGVNITNPTAYNITNINVTAFVIPGSTNPAIVTGGYVLLGDPLKTFDVLEPGDSVFALWEYQTPQGSASDDYWADAHIEITFDYQGDTCFAAPEGTYLFAKDTSQGNTVTVVAWQGCFEGYVGEVFPLCANFTSGSNSLQNWALGLVGINWSMAKFIDIWIMPRWADGGGLFPTTINYSDPRWVEGASNYDATWTYNPSKSGDPYTIGQNDYLPVCFDVQALAGGETFSGIVGVGVNSGTDIYTSTYKYISQSGELWNLYILPVSSGLVLEKTLITDPENITYGRYIQWNITITNPEWCNVTYFDYVLQENTTSTVECGEIYELDITDTFGSNLIYTNITSNLLNSYLCRADCSEGNFSCSDKPLLNCTVNGTNVSCCSITENKTAGGGLIYHIDLGNTSRGIPGNTTFSETVTAFLNYTDECTAELYNNLTGGAMGWTGYRLYLDANRTQEVNCSANFSDVGCVGGGDITGELCNALFYEAVDTEILEANITICGPVLGVWKSTLTPLVIAGGTATFMINITNAGGPGFNLTILETTEPDVDWDIIEDSVVVYDIASSLCPQGVFYNSTTISMYGENRLFLPRIESGNVSCIFTFNVSVPESADAGSYQDNLNTTALICDLSEYTIYTEGVNVTVISTELTIDKYVNNSGIWGELTTAEPGDEVEFIIVVTNPGDAPANNLNIRDVIPPLFDYIENSSYIYNYSGTNVFIGEGNITKSGDISTGFNLTWNLDWYEGLEYEGNNNTLPAGENITLIFRVRVISNITEVINTNIACTNGTFVPTLDAESVISTLCDFAQVEVLHPQLTLTKTGNTTDAEPGDVVEYTIIIHNPSLATAHNITVSDDLQKGFKLISNGTLTFWNGTTINITTIEPVNETSPEPGSLIHWNYTIAYIPPQGNVTLTYNTYVTSDAKCGINVVVVNYSDGYGTSLPYRQDIWEVCPIFRGILTLDKRSIDSIANPGNDVTYEIIVSNSGEGILLNVSLNDALPAGWEYVADSIVDLTPSTCTVTRDGNNFNVGNLAAGWVCRFLYDVRVPELTCFGEYYNYINGTALDTNGTQLNDSSYDSTDIIPDVILDVSKSVNVSSNNNSLVYLYGSVIEFIINVTSRGNTTVYNVTLNDTLALGLEFVNCTNESGSLVTVSTTGSATVGQSINFSAGNITGGSYKVFYMRANVTSAAFEGTNINKIIVYGEGPCGPVITDMDVAAFAIGVPELDVYKWADGGSIEPGGQMTYHVRVRNTGTGTAYNVNVTDVLTGLKYVPDSSYLDDVHVGEPVPSGNRLMWNSTNLTKNLTSGSETTLTFNLTTDLSAGCAVDLAIDEAYANASDGYGNIISNTYSIQTDVIHPFITVTKYANVTKAEAGDSIKYTITVRNPSRATAYNVTVIDVLQAGFVNQSGGSPAPASYAPATRTLTWAPFNISGNNATIILSYNAMVTPNASAPPGVNLVTASAVDGGGCALVNATDAWGVIIFHPAVQVRKNVNVPEAQPGDVLEYEVSVFNPSEARAYNVSVYEFNQTGFYPAGWTAAVYELRTSSIKEWLTYLGTISIQNATVNKTGANVSAIYFDLSNISSVTGSTIRNGSLASYARLTIKFNMTAGANAVTGSDEVWAQCGYYGGTFASMDYDTEHVAVNYPYLIIEKFTMPQTLATASPGDTVTYDIRIINPNSGKADALIWSIIDELPYGHRITSNGTGTLTHANGTKNYYNFTFNSTTGLVAFIPTNWTSNFSITLSPGGELILNFTTYVNSSAELHGCDKASYNATDLMNNSITKMYAEKCLSILKPQVRIAKVSNTTTAEPGSMVEFTLILENRGSSAVYNVTVNDVMSSGWEFIAATQNITGMNDTESNSPGSSSNNTVLFGNITLNAGGKKTIKYTALVTDNASGGLSVNCANITGYGGSGAVYTDGYCINVMVYLPALELIKDVSQHDVEPGSEPLVTIVIENPTYATVYDVTIKEFMPRGFNYTAGSAKINGKPVSDPNITGNPSFDCGSTTTGQLNLTWNLTNTNFTGDNTGALLNIPPKTVKVLTFKVHVKCNVANGTFNNTVNVSGVTGAGGAMGPESTFFEMKGYLADAEIYKYASTNSPTYFEYVDYKIVIWNNPAGANIAPLTLADIMPPYLRYVPGYAYVGDLKLEPAVCGDYTDKTTNSAITNVRNDSGGVNCTGFNGTLMDAEGNHFNASETAGDGKGQTLLWNLSKWLFLTPGQQVTIKYRTTIIPGIARTARNDVTLSYLDPEHPDLCVECKFDMSTYAVIAVNSPPGFVPDDVNYTLNLNRGWNLISVPIRPYNTSISSILAPIEGRYWDVASWNNQWVYRSYAYGDWFGSLAVIEPGKGYWLNMREPASLTVSGETITEFNLTLHGGWNLIGWPSLQPMPLENLSVNYVDAATWDNQWIYRSYAYGDWFGSLSSLEPGKGYWLNVIADSEIKSSSQDSINSQSD